MLDFPAPADKREMSLAANRVSLRDLLNNLFYHGRFVAFVALGIVATGIVAAILLPPTYRAEARLLPLSAGIYDVQSANAPLSPTQALDPVGVANVELQLLGSLELHRAVARRELGPGASAAEIDRELNTIESHLHVTKTTDSNVIELSYTARDPQKAAEMLRQLLAAYFDSRANVLTSGRVAFLVGQRDRVKAQLDAANAAILAYQQRNGIVDITAQIAGAVQEDNLLTQQKLAVDGALADGRQSIATLQSAARTLPAQVELYSDNGESARAIGEMQTQVLQLQSRRADLASRYMKTAPILTQVDKQIAGLQASIERQKADLVTTRRTGRNQFYDSSLDRLTQARATVAGETARGSALDGQIAASGARLKRLIAVSDTIAQMRLDRDLLVDSFKSLSDQVGQAKIQLNQTSSAGSPNVRVIEAPTVPSKRSNPPSLLIAGSIVAALLVSGTVLLVVASLRDTLLSPGEVERLFHLPVLYAPMKRADDPTGADRRDHGRLIATIDGQGARGGRAVLLLAPGSRASLQEAALGLGQALDRRNPGRVALIRFAEDGAVPADAHALEIGRIGDMATGVIGTAACSNRRRDADLLTELRAMYDYVVVTAPPTTLSFEGLELSQVVDLSIVVLEAERTRQPVARDLIAQIAGQGMPAAGVMLLGRRQHIPQWLYRAVIERRGFTK